LRIQGIHEEQPAYNSFHVPNAFNEAGNFHPWGSREGYEMKCIAYTQEFPQKRPGKIVSGFPVEIAHAGRSIEKHNQVHRPGTLTKNAKNDSNDKY